MENTLISWAHHTLNWWWGCEKVSEACRFCYAETMAKIFGRGRCVWGKGGKRWIRDNATRDARTLHAVSKASGARQRIFVNSMSDTFEDHPGLHGARAHALATMEAMPFASWLLLTKRPENVLRMVPPAWLTAWPEHIWIGTTVENQQCADHRIPELIKVPAKVRFLSCEPLLEEVNLMGALLRFDHCDESEEDGCVGCEAKPGPHSDCQATFKRDIHWVICGGESGPHARAMHPDWTRSLRDQCKIAGTPFHFKQWGEFAPGASDWGDHGAEFLPQEDDVDERMGEHRYPAPVEIGEQEFLKVGKKVAGRLLDGIEHDEVPA